MSSTTITTTPSRKRKGTMKGRSMFKRARANPTISKTIRFRPSHQQPVPNMFTDVFEMQFQGQIPIRVGNQTATLCIQANNIVTGSGTGPLLCGPAGTRWDNTTYFVAAPALSATHTDFPTGFKSFVSTGVAISSLYQRYFVTGVGYEFVVQPINVNDALKVCVVPDTPGDIQTTGTNYTSLTEAENAAWAKSKICYGTNTSAGNTIKGYLNVSKFLGLTKSAMVKDHGYSGLVNANTLATTAADKIVSLSFIYQALKLADLSSAVNVGVKLKYYVTLQQSQGKLLSD